MQTGCLLAKICNLIRYSGHLGFMQIRQFLKFPSHFGVSCSPYRPIPEYIGYFAFYSQLNFILSPIEETWYSVYKPYIMTSQISCLLSHYHLSYCPTSEKILLRYPSIIPTYQTLVRNMCNESQFLGSFWALTRWTKWGKVTLRG